MKAHGEEGYILPVVLVLCVMITSLAVATQSIVRSLMLDRRAHEDLLWLAAARHNSATIALLANTARPFSGEMKPLTFSVDRTAVTVSGLSEDVKADVNHADLSLVEAFLPAALQPRVRAAFLDKLGQHRLDGGSVASAIELLLPCWRLTHAADQIGRSLTTSTGLPSIGRFDIREEELWRIPGMDALQSSLLLSTDADRLVQLDDPRLMAVARHLGSKSSLYKMHVEVSGMAAVSHRFDVLVMRGNHGTAYLVGLEHRIEGIDEDYCST